MLIVLSGLPGVGRTTIARELACSLAAVYRVSKRLSIAIASLIVASSIADAQDHPLYVGGAFGLQTQLHSVTLPLEGKSEPLVGTTWSGSALFGAQLSPRLSLEVEPSLGGQYSNEYTYSPGPSWSAHVVAQRRDTFISFQSRIKIGLVEPILGVAYVVEHLSRHATVSGRTYFDDDRIDKGFGATGGLDAAIKTGAHAFIVPTFRMFVTSARSIDPLASSDYDPLVEDTGTGRLVLRYGVGALFIF
jgi:hypothetical protein